MGRVEIWDEYQPTRLLPTRVSNFFSKQARFLYDDLAANKVNIVLIPAPDPRHYSHMVRAVETLNPGWYSNLYAQNPHFRRDRSFSALERIMRKEDQAFTYTDSGAVKYRFHYDSVYRKLIFDRLTEGYSYEGHEFGPNQRVCSYFSLKMRATRRDDEEVPF